MENASAEIKKLQKEIKKCIFADRFGFNKRLKGIQRRLHENKPVDKGFEKLSLDVMASIETLEKRAKSVPDITYDESLPISEKRDEIAELIKNNQVVIICGETGSGKTTQLPKICLEIGRGINGKIGHTQPRRIAARSVSKRIAEELKVELGNQVGFKVRFSDQVKKESLVKLMTDGILLAETQTDRFLNEYDTIIIDEAHERSLNIDFILGFLKVLLPKRPDLKVIITSATIDPESFSQHFGSAPIIEVSGRTYPVETRYRPLYNEDPDMDDSYPEEKDQLQGINDAVDELGRISNGDVLVFLPGERDIREAAEFLKKSQPRAEIVPLFARLSPAEQMKVFAPHGGRRIVLATNVAETSLTVPGIKYVIDSGKVRISRYSYRTKVQRLPIEQVSQASADQRKGRCGRVSSGVCIRLYSEEDFLNQSEFTQPEILRTNLASVILQMKSLRLGDIEDFPFVERPDNRYINDGYKLLQELGAVDEKNEITKIGRILASFPVDPRISRIILAAADNNCLNELLIIGSALGAQDPRDRPFDKQGLADEAHKEFQSELSDFLFYLNLWNAYHEAGKQLSQNKLRKWCKERFISFLRMREWIDVYRQLKQLVTEHKYSINQEPAEYEPIHQSLLSGLLGNVAVVTDKKEYTGARNNKLRVFPGSALVKKQPKWLMAAELIETSRLFASTIAKIEPQWIEQIGAHLCKHHYFEPHWEKKRGQVIAFDRITMYGLTINPKKKVNFGQLDPVAAREVFIRSALVEQDIDLRAEFYRKNKDTLHEINLLESKSRRKDILVDEDNIFDFYDTRIPANINSKAALEKWLKKADDKTVNSLLMTKDELMKHNAEEVTEAQFPDRIVIDDIAFMLDYHFEPGHPKDGVTITAPLVTLNQVAQEQLSWLVPGMIEEKLTFLIKALPKRTRKNFVPVPEFARALTQSISAEDKAAALLPFITRELKRMTGVEVTRDMWQEVQIPTHLLMNIRVVDENGKTLGAGRDLIKLQREFSQQIKLALNAEVDSPFERDDIDDWDFEDLPTEIEVNRGGVLINAYPAIVLHEDVISLKLMFDKHNALERSKEGVLRLIQIKYKEQERYISKNIPNFERMALHYSSIGKKDELRNDIVNAVFEKVFISDKEFPRNRDEYQQLCENNKADLIPTMNTLATTAEKSLEAAHKLRKSLKGSVNLSFVKLYQEIDTQLSSLVYSGFISATPIKWLEHIPRYINALVVRIEKLEYDPKRDSQWANEIYPYIEQYKKLSNQFGDISEVIKLRWMIEELKVSIFAQELKTSMPISAKRVEKQIGLIKKL